MITSRGVGGDDGVLIVDSPVDTVGRRNRHFTGHHVMSDEFESRGDVTEGSPWPILVALGITLSEVGVLFGLRPLSVVGLLLFVGSVAGLFYESGYIARPERTVGIQGVALIGIGLALIAIHHVGSTVRGQSITTAGAISLLAAILWQWYTRNDSRDGISPTNE